MKMTDFPYPECETGTVLEEDKRYFGEYKCENCARWWKSANSWLGFGQDCTGCGELTFPWKLSYLKLQPSTDADDIEKRHPQEKCERCRKLGYYCRKSSNVKLQHNRKGRTNRTKSSGSQTRSYSANKAAANPSKKSKKSTKSSSISNQTSNQTASSQIVSYPSTYPWINSLLDNDDQYDEDQYEDYNYYTVDPPPVFSSFPKSNSSSGFGFWKMTFVTACLLLAYHCLKS